MCEHVLFSCNWRLGRGYGYETWGCSRAWPRCIPLELCEMVLFESFVDEPLCGVLA